MKTGKILNRLQEKIKIRNYEKHKKEVNLLVDTEGLKKHIDVYNEIALAKETIANFAKKNTVSIDIFDTASSAEFAKNTKPELAESMNDCITIRVKDMLTGRAKDAIMPAQTKALTSIHAPIPVCYTTLKKAQNTFIRVKRPMKITLSELSTDIFHD